jgi:hypothetical protein
VVCGGVEHVYVAKLTTRGYILGGYPSESEAGSTGRPRDLCAEPAGNLHSGVRPAGRGTDLQLVSTMTCWLEHPFSEGILFTHRCGCQVVGMPGRLRAREASGILDEPRDAPRLYPDYVTECRQHQAMTPQQRWVDGLPFASEAMILEMSCGCTYRRRITSVDKVRHLIDANGMVRALRSIYRIATCANGQAEDDEDPGIYLSVALSNPQV